ncbi:MAG: hypothetical protein GYB36_08685 [Alphaproteobacteria bacterium]|nr:hypothetical protein [Alphaproteobacteria bacterium]
MGNLRIVSVIACSCVLATGCASAPISIAGSALPVSLAQTQTQLSLRGASNRLQSIFEERGWIRAANSMQQTTRNWMARLTGQRDQADEAEAPGAPPYLAHTNFSTMDSAVAVARLMTDLDEAQDLVRDVDLAAARLVSRDEDVSRTSLTRDLELVERALAQSREALVTFDLAIATVSVQLDEDGLDRLQAHRSELARQSEYLRDRADELAEIRRALPAEAAG